MQNDKRRNEPDAARHTQQRVEGCGSNGSRLEMEQTPKRMGKLALNYWTMAQQRRLRHRFNMATLERNWPRLSAALEKRKNEMPKLRR